MKLKTRLAAKSGNCQRFNVNGQVTAKLETPNKRIMKSNSGCAIAPIGVTLNPLKMKQKKMDQLGHMIKDFIIRPTLQQTHKRGNVVNIPFARASTKLIWERDESLQHHKQLQLREVDITRLP